MKKLIIGTAVVAIIGLFTLQYAGAGPGWGPGTGFGGGCRNWNGAQGPYAGQTVDQEKVDAFFKDTVELRTQLIDKRAEYQKMVLTGDYDRNKAAMLAEEMYQIQDQIREKALKAGLNAGYGRRGPGCGNGWGRGRGVACANFARIR